MVYGEQQKREIETIRERNITLNLSDADCDRLSDLCGEHNITVSKLLENFIGDLVEGTRSNGSDERELAQSWLKRCWFGMFPEPTLLNWLLTWNYDVYEDFLKMFELNWELRISDIKSQFSEFNEQADWDEEVEKVKQWYKEKERFREE